MSVTSRTEAISVAVPAESPACEESRVGAQVVKATIAV